MNISLQHGDCLQLMGAIPDSSVDLILCDLPYGITNCRWDTVLPFDELWGQYKRIIKEHGAILLFAALRFGCQLITSNPSMFRYDLVWEKSVPVGFANSHRMPMRKHELILAFYKRLPTYNTGVTDFVRKKCLRAKPKDGVYEHIPANISNKEGVAMGFPTSILKYPSIAGKRLHPTQKPVQLLEWLIKTYSNEGDLVLDNCAGSQSTGIACMNLKRDYVGMERDEEYYKIGVDRVFKHRDEINLSVDDCKITVEDSVDAATV